MTTSVPDDIRRNIEVLFAPLNNENAAHAIPELGRLSVQLSALFPNLDNPSIALPPETAKLFATASVEVWHRALHSYLISCSLTNVSPIWASVCGYYASHYAVRAFAHLFGHVVLFEKKLVIKLRLDGGAYVCEARKRDGKSREHQHYWSVVKGVSYFSSNPLFRENSDIGSISDAAHRNRANYADHVATFPLFRPLRSGDLHNRIQRIASIEVSAPPIPQRGNFPDLEAVHIVAYHRIVSFRRFVDEILGGSNRFWTVQRNPPWAREFINYQIAESGGLAGTREYI